MTILEEWIQKAEANYQSRHCFKTGRGSHQCPTTFAFIASSARKST